MTQICSPAVHEPSSLLRYGRQDALLVGLTLAHAAVLLLWPSLLVVALGLWWNTNTISHNFIHRPFFRERWLNATYSVGLSLLLGLPQSVWRDRHLAHHAGVQPRLRRTTLLWAEIFCVATLWGLALWLVPWFVAWVYLPGFLLGLGICAAHGHYEHLGGGTISHYGWLYNLLFVNDGYHVEHHADPAASWRRVREPVVERGSGSPWPAVLRWLPARPLDTLERLVLRSKLLQAFVLHVHRRAWRRLAGTLGDRGNIDRVGIVHAAVAQDRARRLFARAPGEGVRGRLRAGSHPVPDAQVRVIAIVCEDDLGPAGRRGHRDAARSVDREHRDEEITGDGAGG